MTFGFEREYFVAHDPGSCEGDKNSSYDFVTAHSVGLPYDGCGYLAEARGDYHTDPDKAAALLLAEERRLRKQAEEKDLVLVTQTPFSLDKTFLHTAMRQFGKSPQSDRSLSGKWNKTGVQHAGLHIHFGNEREIQYYDKAINKSVTVTRVVDFFDMAAIIWALDKEYGKLIKGAKRATGLYKLQPHGFEYRSLPAYADPIEVADFIQRARKTWI